MSYRSNPDGWVMCTVVDDDGVVRRDAMYGSIGDVEHVRCYKCGYLFNRMGDDCDTRDWRGACYAARVDCVRCGVFSWWVRNKGTHDVEVVAGNAGAAPANVNNARR